MSFANFVRLDTDFAIVAVIAMKMDKAIAISFAIHQKSVKNITENTHAMGSTVVHSSTRPSKNNNNSSSCILWLPNYFL